MSKLLEITDWGKNELLRLTAQESKVTPEQKKAFWDEYHKKLKDMVLEIVEESKDKALPLAYITKTVSEL